MPAWIYDPETLCFLAVNDSAVRHYGYERQEFLKLCLPDLFCGPPDKDELADRLFKRGGETTQFRHCKKNRDTIEVRVIDHPLTWGGKEARATYITDLTERRLQEFQNQKRQQEFSGEMRGLEGLADIPTPRSGNSSDEEPAFPLQDFVPEYRGLLEQALEQKIYRVEYNVSRGLKDLAARLSARDAGPRSLVRIHYAALKMASHDMPSKKTQALMECGRLVILELMGYLAAAYRDAGHGHAPTDGTPRRAKSRNQR